MKSKPINYEEFQALGKKYYNRGGDVIVECWDEQAFKEYCEEFGQMTERGALNIIGLYEEMQREEEGNRKCDSGEPDGGWSRFYQEELEMMRDLMCGSVEDDPYEDDDEYIPSATAGDYSPSDPWNAPGMSIHDFI